jgi:hypothetical protein
MSNSQILAGMTKSSKLSMSHGTRPFAHPYIQFQHRSRISLPPSDEKQAVTGQERYLAGEDLRPARMDELLRELDKANHDGVIYTYDKKANGWHPWFRYYIFVALRL